MLRAEHPRAVDLANGRAHSAVAPHDVLIAVAPPPKATFDPLSRWPEWLIPAYRSGGHRPAVHLLEEER